MRRFVLALVFTSVIAMGQSRPTASSLEAYRAKALENALRSPRNAGIEDQSFMAQFQKLQGKGPMVLIGQMPAGVQLCAIPLKRAHVKTNIDPRIEHRLKDGEYPRDSMPTVKAMPVCAE